MAAVERSDAELIAAVGGAEAFRDAVAAREPCIDVHDPRRVWVMVNKQNPLAPLDYAPDDLVWPDVRNVNGQPLRAMAAAALEELIAAARDEGAGEIAMLSGYRPYGMQVSIYGSFVRARGEAGADLISARPGHSEHQTGLTADLVACGGGCGSLEDFGATSQGQWVRDNAWRFGFITRYEEGRTEITGYSPEPWHQRYIGVELAALYHAEGVTTLEEFFGYPGAPGY